MTDRRCEREGCGKPLSSLLRPDARYCSPACRQAVFRSRHHVVPVDDSRHVTGPVEAVDPERFVIEYLRSQSQTVEPACDCPIEDVRVAHGKGVMSFDVFIRHGKGCPATKAATKATTAKPVKATTTVVKPAPIKVKATTTTTRPKPVKVTTKTEPAQPMSVHLIDADAIGKPKPCAHIGCTTRATHSVAIANDPPTFWCREHVGGDK